jgi:pimeloyl-ACP methyl ester carboxylesterase
MFLDVDGARLFTVDVGVGDLPVVLHSGWIGTWEDWLPQIEALSRDTRVVAYDHRGTGRSLSPPEDITRERLMSDLLAVMDAKGIERCVLGGFSSGSSLVLEVASREPERFAGVVLMCPALPGEDLGFETLLRDDFATAIEGFIDLCLPEAAERDVTALRHWASTLLHQAGAEQAVALLRVLRLPAGVTSLTPVTLPSMIVMGAADPLSNASHLDEWQQILPIAEVVLLPGIGHLAAFTATGNVNGPLTRFVANLH